MASCAWPSARAAPVAGHESQIRFRVVDGKLCARCTIRCTDRSIPANVVIDLGTRAPLLLHERTAAQLGLKVDKPVELRFDSGVVLAGLRGLSVALRSLEELTRDYAPALGELPAVAIVGLPAFEGYRPRLDVAEGELRLLPETDASGDGPDAALAVPAPDTVTVPYEEERYGIWLSGVAAGGFNVRVRFATADYDTLIDATTADLAGAPGGDLDQLLIGPLNIAEYVALRPTDLSEMPAPRPDVILGTQLLSYFRVEVDSRNRRIAFEPMRKPRLPTEERQFFIAMVAEDADAIETFLNRHPTSRLVADASRMLLDLRLDEYEPAAGAIQRAVRLRAGSVPAERRATVMVELADRILSSHRDDRYDLATYILDVGLEYASLDLNAKAPYQLQARLGWVALQRGELKQARRHLLSAAFGMPRDPDVNLWMGEFYERSGKLTRAWSRYVQAMIADDPPPAALEGLNRLNRDPAFRASFTMEDAEQLLEGRMLEFHAPERFRAADGDEAVGHVQLVELFSCVDHAPTLAPELAFAGLAEFYSDTDVAFVEYHVAMPDTDPLVSAVGATRAAFYEVPSAPMALFDGGRAVTDGGADRDIHRLYQAYQAASHLRPPPRREWSVAVSAARVGDEIDTTVVVVGPEAAAKPVRVFALLCEKGVMARGANGVVLHRHVARAWLSPSEGWPVEAGGTRRTYTARADVGAVSDELEQLLGAAEATMGVEFLMRPTYVDASACRVVAMVQDGQTRRVLAACAADVQPQRGEKHRSEAARPGD